MVTRKELLDTLLEKRKDVEYNEEKDTLCYEGVEIPFEKYYQTFLKSNGMSFHCICDAYWEDMSVLECTECGTVVKFYYDEWYEPNFRCPTCTDYKTGYEYHTKEEIKNSEELQAIIKMYKDLQKITIEQEERRKKRKGLDDHQLLRPMNIKIGNKTYRFNVLINSIVNKNKLKGLRLQVEKYEKGDTCTTMKWFKTIPLSKEAFHYQRHAKEYQEVFDKEFKGKSLTQTLEDHAVKRTKEQ